MLSKKQKRHLKKVLHGLVPDPRKELNAKSLMKFGLEAARQGPQQAVMNVAQRTMKKAAKKIQGRGLYTMGRGSYTIGRGNYTTSAPVRNGLHTEGISNAPSLRSGGGENGAITISRSEFVTAISSTGSADYVNLTFSVNAALSSCFNWMSQIAANYSEWEPIQLCFRYKPVVSAMSVSSVGSLGTLVMAHNPNAGEAGYSTFDQIINACNAVEGNIAQGMECWVECDPAQANVDDLYVRTGPVPAGQDIKTYDHGKLNFGLYGVPTAYVAGTQLGLLYVDYTIKLRKPRMWTGLGNATPNVLIRTGGVATANAPFGTAPTHSGLDTIGGVMSKDGISSIYTFPDNFEGVVMVTYYQASSVSMTPVDTNLATFGNLLSFNGFVTAAGIHDISELVGAPSGAGETTFIQRWLKIEPTSTAGANNISFDCAVGAGGTVVCRLGIVAHNPLLVNYTSGDEAY